MTQQCDVFLNYISNRHIVWNHGKIKSWQQQGLCVSAISAIFCKLWQVTESP